VEDVAALTKARSLLIILLATCKETLLALEATANALDTDMTADMKAMIERSNAELVSAEREDRGPARVIGSLHGSGTE
jgi:hypothetical protein